VQIDEHWIHILKMANELNCQHNNKSTNRQFCVDTTRGKGYDCLALDPKKWREKLSMMVLEENEVYCGSWVTDIFYFYFLQNTHCSFNNPKKGVLEVVMIQRIPQLHHPCEQACGGCVWMLKDRRSWGIRTQ
jgi:hypothetical protein